MATNKLFKRFPPRVYVVHTTDDEGFFMLFEDKDDAAHAAKAHDSEVAFYEFADSGEAVITTTITIR